jgi:putative transposase
VPISRQCALLQVTRSSAYYTPNTTESEQNLALMRLIDEQYLKTPFYGSPRMTWWLNQQGYRVNRKRVARLMSVMGLQATLPGPHTSVPHPEHRSYPYLLREMEIGAPCEVWCADITYVPMRRGFMYLVAVMDWFSRYVLAWDLSNTMESGFCVMALKKALKRARPGIFNTDQGSQFTSDEFTGTLSAANVRISMDGRGRALDNAFIERLWRTVKYEDLYLREYVDGHALHAGLARYFRFYNHERPHSALNNHTPASCHKWN